MSVDLERDRLAIEMHYNMPEEFFKLFLDKRMSYTCNYFTSEEESLDQASENKLHLICKKLDLKPGDRVLDIGCGWGNFLFYAVEKYDVQATGITLSSAQAQYIAEETEKRGLNGRVKAEIIHALEMPFAEGTFDKIVTIGAIEHILDLPKLFQDCRSILTPEGLMLVHGMSKPWKIYVDERNSPPDDESNFLSEYIFPVGELIPLHEIVAALEKNSFEVIDVENITDHYTLTLSSWLENLQKHEDEVLQTGLIPAEKLRAQILFLAGCVEYFQTNHNFTYQILVRPFDAYKERTALPLTRERLMFR
ncbi:MAG: cyclopropane-fatty-acyl-phospholipid synthase [Clostridia bacterium]|nr:cyclopropane-fatty-acyl-phospholipid synthase [Clostridia bacterium]